MWITSVDKGVDNMKVSIIAVGKIKEKYIQSGIDEFSKRLRTDVKFEVIEVPDEKAPERLSEKEMEQIKQKEGERIEKKIKAGDYVIVLERQGKMLSSEQLAERFETLPTYGTSAITFIIGGSLGMSQELLQRADLKWSFSALTFPHQLMRLMLTEQIYRALQINKGSPYHK